MNYKVSIIVPTFNRAHLIEETINSFIVQSYKNWECIIVDDGSEDNTKEIVENIVDSEKRVKYYLRTNKFLKGPSGCRNFGFEKSKGDFVLFFDDDDILHPLNLEICVLALANTNYSFCRYMREEFKNKTEIEYNLLKDYSSFEIDSKDLECILKFQLFCVTGSIIWKRECLFENKFVEELSFAEDWELYSRIISNGFKGISINKCLFYGRQHLNSITSTFYLENPVSKRSYNDAILLVVENLKEKNLLTSTLFKYFIQFSLNFKDSNLFENLISTYKMSKVSRLKWELFYLALPLRLNIYKYWLQLNYKNK